MDNIFKYFLRKSEIWAFVCVVVGIISAVMCFVVGGESSQWWGALTMGCGMIGWAFYQAIQNANEYGVFQNKK